MARLDYVDLTRSETSAAASRVTSSRGSVSLLYRMLLHSPPVALGWLELLNAVRRDCELSGELRELVILRIASLNDAAFEWQAHAPIGLAEGLTQEQLDALPQWEGAGCFDETERAVLAYADAMTRTVHVADAVYAAVALRLSERELVELTVTVAAYNMVSRVLEALQIQPGDVLGDG